MQHTIPKAMLPSLVVAQFDSLRHSPGCDPTCAWRTQPFPLCVECCSVTRSYICRTDCNPNRNSKQSSSNIDVPVLFLASMSKRNPGQTVVLSPAPVALPLTAALFSSPVTLMLLRRDARDRAVGNAERSAACPPLQPWICSRCASSEFPCVHFSTIARFPGDQACCCTARKLKLQNFLLPNQVLKLCVGFQPCIEMR